MIALVGMNSVSAFAVAGYGLAVYSQRELKKCTSLEYKYRYDVDDDDATTQTLQISNDGDTEICTPLLSPLKMDKKSRACQQDEATRTYVQYKFSTLKPPRHKHQRCETEKGKGSQS